MNNWNGRWIYLTAFLFLLGFMMWLKLPWYTIFIVAVLGYDAK